MTKQMHTFHHHGILKQEVRIVFEDSYGGETLILSPSIETSITVTVPSGLQNTPAPVADDSAALREAAQQLQKMLVKLSNAAVTPMDKRRYQYLELVRSEASALLAKLDAPQ